MDSNRLRLALCLSLGLALCLGCESDPSTADAGGLPPDGALADAAARDSGTPFDAGPFDAGPPVDAAVAPGWRVEPPVPVRIQEIAGALHQGRLVIAGGFNGSTSVVTTVRAFDPSTSTWSELPSLPLPRHHMALVSTGPDLYALGGMQTLSFTPLDTAWVLREGASEWTPIAPLLEARASGVGAFIDGRIYIAGGQADRLARAVMIYDPTSDAWSLGADMPTPREHTAGFVHEGELWVVAGRMLSLDSNSTAVHVYDPAADTWREGPSIPTARGGHGVAVLDGRAYAVGGEQPDMALDSMEVLDLSAGTWSTAPAVPTRRHGHVVLAAAGRIWVIGGADRPIFAAVDDLESFAP